MMKNDSPDYLMETRLRELNPDLHRRFTDTVVTIQSVLFRFQKLFPDYTDHSALHSLTVLDFCNYLIGPAQMMQLNADAIYTLLMSCYLHDVGMGITRKQYQEYKEEIPFGNYFGKRPDADEIDVVAARNPVMLYDVESFSDELDIAYFRRHESVKELIIEEDAFVLHAVHIDPSVDRMVWDMAVKMQETLEYSREATFQRSPFRISQREVRLVYLD